MEVEGILGVQDLPEVGSLGIVFLCRFRSGEPRPDGREVDRAEFFGIDDLARMSELVESWSEWVALRVLREGHRLLPGAPDNPYAPRNGFF